MKTKMKGGITVPSKNFRNEMNKIRFFLINNFQPNQFLFYVCRFFFCSRDYFVRSRLFKFQNDWSEIIKYFVVYMNGLCVKLE